jgi:1,4-dihydroxy-2-naphthoate octaprenyltransferase
MNGYSTFSTSAWLHAARLRTLPLAVSGIVAGNMLARFYGKFDPVILLLSLLTALWLQILSNLANDYGDYTKGTDNDARIGPTRALQSGKISPQQMKTALIICTLLALGSGIPLVILGTRNLDWFTGLFFLLLGLLSIAAAIFYTVGKNAYGYRGLGDVFVFLFFGIIAVTGSFYLQYKTLEWPVFLPAVAIGFFSTGVLNMNNMRDVENDRASGKITLAVRLGKTGSIVYHHLLMLSGAASAAAFQFMEFTSEKWMFLLPLLLIIPHLLVVVSHKNPTVLDKQLKVVVLITLFYTAGLTLSVL